MQFHVLMHSEVKQTSDFGAEKAYCRAEQGEQVAHAQKT